MCEIGMGGPIQCERPTRFHVHIAVVPQTLTVLGTEERETSPAGRSITVCGIHLTTAVRRLGALPIRTTSTVSVTAVAPVVAKPFIAFSEFCHCPTPRLNGADVCGNCGTQWVRK